MQVNDNNEIEKVSFIKESTFELIDIIKKIFGFINKNYALLSAVVIAFISGCLWCIKGLWYVYNIGCLSVYKIDKNYIDMDEDNFLLKTFTYVMLVMVFLLINWYYYKILNAKDGVGKKIKNIVFFYVIEWYVILILMMIMSTDITLENIWMMIVEEQFVILVVAIFIICAFLNLLGMFMHIDLKSSIKKENNYGYKKFDFFTMGKSLLIFIIIEFFVCYTSGVLGSRTKVDYRVIVEECAKNEFDKSVFELDGYSAEIYPIVFENNDIYILSKIYRIDNEIKIDYNYQKVVEKNGQETYYVRNISLINYDK